MAAAAAAAAAVASEAAELALPCFAENVLLCFKLGLAFRPDPEPTPAAASASCCFRAVHSASTAARM